MLDSKRFDALQNLSFFLQFLKTIFFEFREAERDGILGQNCSKFDGGSLSIRSSKSSMVELRFKNFNNSSMK